MKSQFVVKADEMCEMWLRLEKNKIGGVHLLSYKVPKMRFINSSKILETLHIPTRNCS